MLRFSAAASRITSADRFCQRGGVIAIGLRCRFLAPICTSWPRPIDVRLREGSEEADGSMVEKIKKGLFSVF